MFLFQVLHQDGSYVKTIGNGAIGNSFGVAALSLPQHGICYAVTDYNDGCVRVSYCLCGVYC